MPPKKLKPQSDDANPCNVENRAMRNNNVVLLWLEMCYASVVINIHVDMCKSLLSGIGPS